MAGDWIKMRVDLGDDPAVIAIAAATRLHADCVVGKLHRFWSWAGRHTVDGHLPGVSAAWIDQFLARRGFAAAMSTTIPPWLTIDDGGVTIPRFDRHNGTSAKSRAENTKRQQLSRASRDKSATDARPEKRREEKRRSDPPPPLESAALNGHATASGEVEVEEDDFLNRLAANCREKIHDCPIELEAALATGLAKGLTRKQLWDRCAWWFDHWHEWLAEHRPGAMHHGIVNAMPGMKPDQGWPHRRK